MKYFTLEYLAVFVYELSTQDNGPSIFFPDVPGCVTCADSTDEGIKMAKEAMGLWFHDTSYYDLPRSRNSSEMCKIIPVRIDPTSGRQAEPLSDRLYLEYYVIIIDYVNRQDILIPDFPEIDLDIGDMSKDVSNTPLNNLLQIALNKNIKSHLEYTIPTPRKKDEIVQFHLIQENVEIDDQGIIHTPGVVEFPRNDHC